DTDSPVDLPAQSNVCAPNLVTQFANLKHHGEVLGFHMGVADVSDGSNSASNAFDPTNAADIPGFPAGNASHWQGITRYDAADGTPHLFLTLNGDRHFSLTDLTVRGRVVTVTMDSRDPFGLRLRSNRLSTSANTEDTPPELSDRITNVETDTDFLHPGGPQAVGDLLAVAYDQPIDLNEDGIPDGSTVNGAADLQGGRFVIFDVRDPDAPIELYRQDFDHPAGDIGMTRLDDGTHLVVLGGFDGNSSLDFFQSDGTDVGAGGSFSQLDLWSELDRNEDGRPDNVVATANGGFTSWPNDNSDLTVLTAGYQALTLINECGPNGSTTPYLLAGHNQSQINTGDNVIDLYQVDIHNSEVELTLMGRKTLECGPTSGAGTNCNLNAASGAHVDINGDLIVYATEHDNDGEATPATGTGTVKMVEYRHEDVTLAGTCTEPWAELYDDTDFADRSIVFDWADQDLENWGDFSDNLDNFDNKASSIRYCAPIGCDLILVSEPAGSGGNAMDLPGTGQVEAISDFGAFSDAPSRLQWQLTGQQGAECTF
ncbi:MAG: hypothetical protein ACJAZO_001672, partial [Myxococcota bacterium]